ncbi:MAG: hypothetical protein ABW043_12705 [Devosia sp.]|uniref:hypothetical protein n=1 Tax=Devosia sp. TaxID=1871048 RepID=UPI0033929851
MAGDIDPTIEPDGSPELPLAQVAKGKRSAYLGAFRALTEKEITTPAVAMTLIERVEQLEAEKAQLGIYKDKYHEIDKELAVLRANHGGNLGNDLVFGVTLSAGFAAIGYAPSVWDQKGAGGVLLAIGIVVVLVGIAARAVRK